MRIVLINPPRLNEMRADNPCFIEEERGFAPPLGLLYIAAYLKEYADYRIDVIDAQAEGLGYDEGFKKRIPRDDDLVVGITAMTFTLQDVLRTISMLREVEREAGIKIRIVLGGIHPTIYPEETLGIPGVDYVVTGEGEVSFFELCGRLAANQEPHGTRGVLFRENGAIINNGPREFIDDIDSLPFPARRLTDIRRYYSILSRGKKVVTTMFTSRGCPYKCSFCDRPQLGKRFRARSAANVINEIRQCIEMGIQEIFIYDDTFTVSRQRVMEICDGIIASGLKIDWDIRSRVDTVDREMLARLKEAGCRRIHFGVEAGTEKILKVLNKDIAKERAEDVFGECRRLHIETLAYFMIGSPSETKEDIAQTVSFALRLRPDYLHATIFTPYPGTAIYEKALRDGVIKNDYWQAFAKNPRQDFKTPYWRQGLSEEELLKLLEGFYHSFYGRPSYILTNLFKIRSAGELKRKIKAGAKILKYS
jgi:radical SAM superfamily enzyme YgiQ (UPF0313 family)